MGDTGDSPNEKRGSAAAKLRSPSISPCATAVRVCHSAVPLLGLGFALLTAGAEQLSCVVCGGFARLLALARDKETRALTPQERTLYLAGT